MTRNHIGKTVYFAAGNPATNNSAGFEAMTWVKAAGVVSAFQFGITHANTAVPDLEAGFTTGLKGGGEGADSTGTWRKIAADTGQALAKTTSDAQQGLISVKIITGSGVDAAPVTGDPVEYAQGYLHSYTKNQPSIDGYEGFSVSFHQNAVSIEATQPA